MRTQPGAGISRPRPQTRGSSRKAPGGADTLPSKTASGVVILTGEEGSVSAKANCLLIESWGTSLESQHSVGDRGGAETGEFKSNLCYSVSIVNAQKQNSLGKN